MRRGENNHRIASGLEQQRQERPVLVVGDADVVNNDLPGCCETKSGKANSPVLKWWITPVTIDENPVLLKTAPQHLHGVFIAADDGDDLLRASESDITSSRNDDSARA